MRQWFWNLFRLAVASWPLSSDNSKKFVLFCVWVRCLDSWHAVFHEQDVSCLWSLWLIRINSVLNLKRRGESLSCVCIKFLNVTESRLLLASAAAAHVLLRRLLKLLPTKWRIRRRRIMKCKWYMNYIQTFSRFIWSLIKWWCSWRNVFIKGTIPLIFRLGRIDKLNV